MIKIGHASNGEHGATGNQIGDQGKGKREEVKISNWYDHPWNVYLEHPDPPVREKAASFMERICKNNKIGYDQSQRTTMYESIVKHGGNIEEAEGETDCSNCVSVCYKLAGIDISIDNTTRSLKSALVKLGFKTYTDVDHLKSDKFAVRGGIYLSEGHHVVMALENGIERLTADDAQDYYFNEGTPTNKFDMLLIKSLQIIRVKAFTVRGAIIEWSSRKLKDGTPVIGDRQGMIDDLEAYQKNKTHKISQSRIEGFLIKSVKYLKEGGK